MNPQDKGTQQGKNESRRRGRKEAKAQWIIPNAWFLLAESSP
jgi:hypothetical protein